MHVARAVSAAPDAAIGIGFLLTWIAPRSIGVGMLSYALLTMLLEFIVIHSAAFMGSVILQRRSKAGASLKIVGLGLMYTLFVGAFAFAFEQWWPLVAFWSLTLNRLTGVLFHTAPNGLERERLTSSWATSAMLYLFWVFATVFLPLPRLALSGDVVGEAQLPGSGLWVESPHRLIVAGAGYFLSQAYIELAEPAWTHWRDRSAVGRPSG